MSLTYVLRAAIAVEMSAGFWTDANTVLLVDPTDAAIDVRTAGSGNGIVTNDAGGNSATVPISIRFSVDTTYILLNGVTVDSFAGLPAGFTPVTAQVDSNTQNGFNSALPTFTLSFDAGTVSGVNPITAGPTVVSFPYPGAVIPDILTLVSNGFGLTYYPNGFIIGATVVDLLQISGTYIIAGGGEQYWNNPVTNHKRYATTTPPGGNWVVVPPFTPDDTAIVPAVGSTSGGDFVSITGMNFDDSAAFNTTIGGLLITSPITVNSELITGYTQAHAAGAVDVVLTNLDGSTSTLVNGFTYAAPQWWMFPPDGPWWFGGPPVLPPVVPPVVPVPEGATPPADTQGWYWSNTGFAGGSFLALSPGNPQHARGWDKVFDFANELTSGNLGGLPSVNYQNTIIYAGDDYLLGSLIGGNPSVRLFDGNADRLLVNIPNTSAGDIPKAIMSMLLVGTIVYISTFDKGTTHLTYSGRVFAYDILAQTLTPIATAFTLGEMPYALAWHMDRLWVGTNHGDGSLGVVYWLRPNIDTAWTAEAGITGSVTAMQSFGGQLYIACSQVNGTFAKIYKRNSDTTYSTVATGTGGAAQVNNGWLSLCVFNGVLYSGYWNPDSPLIAKVYSITTGGTVTLVYTGATDTLAPYLAIFVSNNVLYVLGCADEIQVALISSPDGVTFTDVSGNINTLNTETAIPVFGTIGY